MHSSFNICLVDFYSELHIKTDKTLYCSDYYIVVVILTLNIIITMTKFNLSFYYKRLYKNIVAINNIFILFFGIISRMSFIKHQFLVSRKLL